MLKKCIKSVYGSLYRLLKYFHKRGSCIYPSCNFVHLHTHPYIHTILNIVYLCCYFTVTFIIAKYGWILWAIYCLWLTPRYKNSAYVLFFSYLLTCEEILLPVWINWISVYWTYLEIHFCTLFLFSLFVIPVSQTLIINLSLGSQTGFHCLLLCPLLW